MNCDFKTCCAPYQTGNNHGLRISGRVTAPLFLGIESLRSMDTQTTDDLPLHCGSGESKGRLGTCRGVLLSDIINNAEIVVTDHNDTKKMFVVAASDDGYKAVFSWQEIFNSSNGEGILVLLERDGTPLYEGCGKVDLLSARDYLSGPRYVKNLKSVEIVMVE
jgi:hypothetical protein